MPARRRAAYEAGPEDAERTMTPTQLDTFKQRLEAIQRELQTQGPARLEPNRTGAETVGDNEDEQPLNEMLQAVASGRNRNAAETLRRIAHALQKLREDPDDFNQCEDCGDDIPPGRLNALPYAEFCVACQSIHDAPKGGPTRKKLTDYR